MYLYFVIFLHIKETVLSCTFSCPTHCKQKPNSASFIAQVTFVAIIQNSDILTQRYSQLIIYIDCHYHLLLYCKKQTNKQKLNSPFVLAQEIFVFLFYIGIHHFLAFNLL